MSGQNISGVNLQTDTGSDIQVILRDGDGMERLLPPVTPAEDLVRAVGVDCSGCRRAIQQLSDRHPLFAQRLDIPEEDLLDKPVRPSVRITGRVPEGA